MRISDLVAAMDHLAPPELAEDWDNVGLLIGTPDAALTGPVLLTIDLTPAVLDEAVSLGAGAIVAYHPLLFTPLRRLVDAQGSTDPERVAVRAIRAGIAVHSPHTALDAAQGGVTDWLADGLLGAPNALGTGGDRRALKFHASLPASQQVKVVTFVPETHIEQVRGGLASAGAGRIGAYEVCSFAAEGTGTFFGAPGTSPAVGRPGRLESVRELRLEMVCPRRAIALAIATLRQFHPYQEPAVDVYPLEPKAERAVGAGRRITLDQPATLGEIADRLKRHIGVGAVHVAAAPGTEGPDARVDRIGVVPGSGGSVVPLALAEQCQVFVTGEMKHHEINAALAQGISVILGGHTATERGYLPTLADRLGAVLPGARVLLSKADRDPLVLH